MCRGAAGWPAMRRCPGRDPRARGGRPIDRASGRSDLVTEPAFTIVTVRDAAGLAAVAALFRAYAAGLPVDPAYQDFAAELAARPGKYAGPAGALLLARAADGTAIGCVGLRPMPDGCGEMKRLYDAPEARGLGLGRALMDA